MAIRRLPEYLINRLVTGEIAERPASILKELVENSLDAGATTIKIDIHDGGKTLISVEDDGSGIELSDMDFLFERYSTSRIYGEQDLSTLSSYGFRGEALAEIAKVSRTTLISKTEYSEIGTKITKLGMDPIIKHQPVGFVHGTIVTVQDLFYNAPERLKSLKSSQTEFFYCYNYIVDIALMYPEKLFIFKKNDKVIFNLVPRNSLMKRIADIYKKDRSKHIKELDYQDEELSLHGIVGDPQLLFGSAENIKIYINKRPIQDKIVIKAIMDAYHKQLSPNEYPLAIVMIDAKPTFVDINVDPGKLEIRFADSRRAYDTVYTNIQQALGEQKISTIHQQFPKKEPSSRSADIQHFVHTAQANTSPSGEPAQFRDKDIGGYTVIGQLRNSYIIIESADTLYYIDQHALAERMLFENIKAGLKHPDGPVSEILLQPIMIEITDIPGIDQKLDEINALGFDISMIGENKVAVYSVPQVFSMYKIDMEKVFNAILYLTEVITFDHILDKIFVTHACKVSIKTGDKLSLSEMINVVKDGCADIPGFFTRQYDKPIFVKIEKKDIDNSFDR